MEKGRRSDIILSQVNFITFRSTLHWISTIPYLMHISPQYNNRDGQDELRLAVNDSYILFRSKLNLDPFKKIGIIAVGPTQLKYVL